MSARILNGRDVSNALMESLSRELGDWPFRPNLVFIRAGDDPASDSYIRSKARQARRAGISSETLVLPPETSPGQLLDEIERLNHDTDVDGILVQLPLYRHLDPDPILEAIDPAKDVDGFHPVNVGRLWLGEAGLVPATPAGLIRILDHYRIPIEGRHVVIIGRSNLVGKPAAALFLRRHATVTVTHSRTRNLPDLTRQADILVPSTGKPGMITPEWVKTGVVVLDVGQSSVDGRLRGDMDPAVAEVATAITPTPGGTGPMTVAMVIHNTVAAARARRAGGG